MGQQKGSRLGVVLKVSRLGVVFGTAKGVPIRSCIKGALFRSRIRDSKRCPDFLRYVLVVLENECCGFKSHVRQPIFF